MLSRSSGGPHRADPLHPDRLILRFSKPAPPPAQQRECYSEPSPPPPRGRMIPNQPGLLVELSRLLKMSQSELVTIIVPYVIGWICTYRKMHDLEVGGGGRTSWRWCACVAMWVGVVRVTGCGRV